MRREEFAYMSPEMVRGDHVDHRTDLFSVGTLLYELLTGVNPFIGKNDIDTLMRTREAQFVPLSVLRPDLPRGLETIINAALSSDPNDRYQTAETMEEALTSVLASLGVELTPRELSVWLSACFRSELQEQSEHAELMTRVGPGTLAEARRSARLSVHHPVDSTGDPESFPRGLRFILADARVPPPCPGSLFGPYLIEQRAFMPSKFRTYLASSPVDGDNDSSRTFLLKICELGRDRADVIEILNSSHQIFAELRFATTLVHEAIAQTHELGVIGQYLCAATEHIAGHDIGQLMSVDWFDPESHPYRGSGKSAGTRYRIPLGLVLLIGQRVCDALIHAEEKRKGEGVDLRVDLSPWQIMIGFNGSVKLLDIGLNRVAALMLRSLSAGSWERYRYLAPERAVGRRGDQRSELYSLGLVLYEALAGRPWIEGEPKVTLRAAVQRGRESALAEIDLEAPDSLKAVLSTALNPCAEHRYQSAREMSDALCLVSGIDGLEGTREELARFMSKAFPTAS